MAMSGVTLADNVAPRMNELRLKKSQYVLLAIGDDGKQIIVKDVGERGSTYEDFVAKMSEDEPVYAAFDFTYEIDGAKRDKLLLVQWIPDGVKPRSKMLYSSSRDALHPVSEGYLPIQANDKSDLEKDEVIRRIKAHRGA
ncbi:cofilin [Strigomonas culicis]|uniref:Cofilin n=1 Tax=Strigomonas culicis TaxID=28005 RepID=S9U8E3_9TRYP|nr:cofilin [Strigomonas culicis]EPY36442.1 cofilin [Strigomonas culicis]|eukprot:EPY25059.1 cofilin [Strigomonas culicis]